MPRRLLRDGKGVDDDWRYAAEFGDAGEIGHAGNAGSIIFTFESWMSQREGWFARPERIGVILEPADAAERLVPDLARLALVGSHFPAIGEGRGYTQARLIRERYQFGGELRATGYVRRDQLFFLARCGFNSFELPESEVEAAGAAFRTFSAAYQPAGDAGLPARLKHR